MKKIFIILFYYFLSGIIIGLGIMMVNLFILLIGLILGFGPFIIGQIQRGLDPGEIEKMNKENEMINRYVGKYRNHND